MGIQGSGTSQMSESLNGLGIEVGHESSNTEDQFCRDGTISWLHAIGAFNHTADISLLCSAPRHKIVHSSQYVQSPCSYRYDEDGLYSTDKQT